MPDFDFTFVVSGVDVTNDDQMEALAELLPDAVPGVSAGRTSISFLVTARSGSGALSSAWKTLRRAIPSARLEFVDENLVGIPDIALLTGRSEESVRQLADGTRGSGDFPIATTVLKGGARIWRWQDVCAWFAARGEDHSDGVRFIERADLAKFILETPSLSGKDSKTTTKNVAIKRSVATKKTGARKSVQATASTKRSAGMKR